MSVDPVDTGRSCGEIEGNIAFEFSTKLRVVQ